MPKGKGAKRNRSDPKLGRNTMQSPAVPIPSNEPQGQKGQAVRYRIVVARDSPGPNGGKQGNDTPIAHDKNVEAGTDDKIEYQPDPVQGGVSLHDNEQYSDYEHIARPAYIEGISRTQTSESLSAWGLPQEKAVLEEETPSIAAVGDEPEVRRDEPQYPDTHDCSEAFLVAHPYLVPDQDTHNPLTQPIYYRHAQDLKDLERVRRSRDRWADKAEYLEQQLKGYQEELERCRQEVRNLEGSLREQTQRVAKDDQQIQYQRKLEATISELKKTGLSSVDRYTPLVDDDVAAAFKRADKKIIRLGREISKMDSRLPEVEKVWKIIHLSWKCAFPARPEDLPDDKGGIFQRQLFQCLIWKWLFDELMSRPFACFGGNLAPVAGSMYEKLFKGDTFESGKWRANTVEAFRNSANHERSDEEITKHMHLSFNDLLTRLGYGCIDDKMDLDHAEPKDKAESEQPPAQRSDYPNLTKILQQLLSDVIPFTQDLTSQRALYKLHIPCTEKGPVFKEADDPDWKNCDSTFDAENEERAGQIWHVGKPGLIKYEMLPNNTQKDQVIVPAFVVLKKA